LNNSTLALGNSNSSWFMMYEIYIRMYALYIQKIAANSYKMIKP